jgi:hypothetical protein
MVPKLMTLFAILAAFGHAQIAAPNEEMNTALMHSTFLISGPQAGTPNHTSFGTVFFLGTPSKENPKQSNPILITAAHVLDGIGGETATLLLRRKAAGGTYTAYDFSVQIRDNGKPLYAKHEQADVAVMRLRLPLDLPISIFPLEFLTDDKRMEELGIHPGDEVSSLGFPLFTSGPGGFPILRFGKLGSYPLIPASVAKTWNYDVLIYPGNSGGPVYFNFENRSINNAVHVGQTDRGILGLIIQQVHSSIPEFADLPLNWAVIVPAQFIKETIDKLPSLSY